MPSWEETERMLAKANDAIGKLQQKAAELRRKADFNEGLRDVAMRDNAIKDRQIAAKDAALQTIRECQSISLARTIARAALAAPAQETE